MHDLIGPNPCEGECPHGLSMCNKVGDPNYGWHRGGCPEYQHYAAKLDLLEALKSRGRRVVGGNQLDWIQASDLLELQSSGPGHLVFIPEARA